MSNEPCQAAKDLIRSSAVFESGKGFTRSELCESIKKAGHTLDYEFAPEVLRQMEGEGIISKTTPSGKENIYRRVDKSAQELVAGSWRTHTNEELGIEPLDPWAVV